MQISIGSLLEGARQATGTAIIIDVFRAFTTAAVAFSRGAESIVLVAEVDEALELRRRGTGDLCMGEVGGMRPNGFDFGNSPYEISEADVEGKRLIQSTRAGTVGVAAAQNATQIYAGSLVIAEATVNAVRRDSPDMVSIVAMGAEGRERADEDEQCALYMRNLLEGRKPDHEAVRSLVLTGGQTQRYGDPQRPHFHPKDVEYALQIDSVPFAIRVRREDGLLVARPESIKTP
jgi:2-phosphosulfolactate phosphatase